MTTTETPQISNESDSTQVRHAIATDYLDQMQNVLKRTKDKKAQQIWNALHPNLVIGKPVAGGVEPLDGEARNTTSYLTPFLPQDSKLEYWNTFEDNSLASFISHLRSIVIRTDSYSPLQKGLVCWHEVFHAWDVLVMGRRSDTYLQYCDMERDALQFQAHLTSIIGGPVYNRILRTEIARFQSERAKQKDSKSTNYPEPLRDIPQLNAIFGESHSDKESISRSQTVWWHAAFIDLSKKYPKEAGTVKSRFVHTVYSRHSRWYRETYKISPHLDSLKRRLGM
jgi:hypothetical protein